MYPFTTWDHPDIPMGPLDGRRSFSFKHIIWIYGSKSSINSRTCPQPIQSCYWKCSVLDLTSSTCCAMVCNTSSSYSYWTQVRSLQSTLVIHSLTKSLLLLWLEWCDSGWWGLLLNASWWSYTWAMLVNSNMMADIWPRFEAAFWLHILFFFFSFHTFLTISYDCFLGLIATLWWRLSGQLPLPALLTCTFVRCL